MAPALELLLGNRSRAEGDIRTEWHQAAKTPPGFLRAIRRATANGSGRRNKVRPSPDGQVFDEPASCRVRRGHHQVSRPASRARRPSALPREIPHDRPPIPIPWDSSPTLPPSMARGRRPRRNRVPDRQRPPLRPSGRGVPRRKCPPRESIGACGNFRRPDAIVRVPTSVGIRSGGEQGFGLEAGRYLVFSFRVR